MKSVLISVQPQWCRKILNVIFHTEEKKPVYEKSVEIRKTRPKIETPFKVYIYCTRGRLALLRDDSDAEKYKYDVWDFAEFHQSCGRTVLGSKVIAEFVCDSIRKISYVKNDESVLMKSTAEEFILGMSALTHDEIATYLKDGSGYAWHISNLVIYDKPRELRDFHKYGVCPCGAKPILHCTENMSFCAKRNLTRPPQSWCYVEETS